MFWNKDTDIDIDQLREQLIIDETPQADVAFRLAIQDSWARNSNVAKASLEWIFSDSYMYARNPEDNIVSNFVIAEDEDQGSVWGARFCVLAWLDDTAADDGAVAEDEDDGEEGDFVFTVHVERGQYTCLAAERT